MIDYFRTKSCSILLFNCCVYSSQTIHAAKREEKVDPTTFLKRQIYLLAPPDIPPKIPNVPVHCAVTVRA